MATNSMQELFVEQLQDLYDAERQILKALPKMIDAAGSEELRSALTEHLEITKSQAGRIEKICEDLDEEPDGDKCKGMAGVIQEGNDHVRKAHDQEMRDAVIVAAAQRVEHYEIAGYGTARTYAKLLGYEEAATLLQQTLDEEKEADFSLTALAAKLNVEAMNQGNGQREKASDTSRGERSHARGKSTRGKRAA